MTVLEYWCVLGVAWIAVVLLLSRKLPLIRSMDIACVALLVYLMVMSGINDEYSIKYLAGGR